MPIVNISILEGRTDDQKRAMAKGVTEAICESIGCGADKVSIIITDMPRNGYATGGTLVMDK